MEVLGPQRRSPSGLFVLSEEVHIQVEEEVTREHNIFDSYEKLMVHEECAHVLQTDPPANVDKTGRSSLESINGTSSSNSCLFQTQACNEPGPSGVARLQYGTAFNVASIPRVSVHQVYQKQENEAF